MGFDTKKLGSFIRSLPFRVRTTAAQVQRATKQVIAGERDALLHALGKDRYQPLATGKLADPPLMSDTGRVLKYVPIRGTVFDEGPSEKDVAQGMIGDCYFMASLASVARSRPELIENAIKRNDDGTVTVTFHNPDGTPAPIAIDADLPRLDLPLAKHASMYGGSNTPGELWPALMEKAYAQWKGGYEGIGRGGWSSNALAALTGLPTQSLAPGSTPPDELGRRLQALIAAKAAVNASTRSEESFSEQFPSLADNHVYSIERAEQRDGNWFVKLRNPWGVGEPANNGKNDGAFELPLADFQRAFYAVDWVQ